MAAQAEKMAGKAEKMAEEVDREVEPTYDIEGIVGYRRKKGKMEFNVKWAGYSYKENSWEGLENLEPAIIWVVDYLEDQDMMPLLDEVYTFYGIVEKAPKKNKKEDKKATEKKLDEEVKKAKAKNKKTAKDVDVTMAKKEKNSKKTTEENSDKDVKNGTAKIADQKKAKSVDIATAKEDKKPEKAAADNLDKDVKETKAANKKAAKDVLKETGVDLATVENEKQKKVNYLKRVENKTTKKADPLYYVEGISCHRRRYNKLQFFVKWANFDASENTWEPLGNLRTAKEFVYEYLERFNLTEVIKEVKVYYGDV